MYASYTICMQIFHMDCMIDITTGAQKSRKFGREFPWCWPITIILCIFFCVVFVDHCLSLYLFSVGHCIVFTSMIYDFWLLFDIFNIFLQKCPWCFSITTNLPCQYLLLSSLSPTNLMMSNIQLYICLLVMIV
jgi:hypothetical protein